MTFPQGEGFPDARSLVQEWQDSPELQRQVRDFVRNNPEVVERLRQEITQQNQSGPNGGSDWRTTLNEQFTRAEQELSRNFNSGVPSGRSLPSSESSSGAPGNEAGRRGQAPNQSDQLRQEVKRSLDQRGFGETLKRMVRETRRDVQQERVSEQLAQRAELQEPNVSGPSGTSGGTAGSLNDRLSESMSDAARSESMQRVISGLRDDVSEMVRDGRFQVRAPETRGGDRGFLPRDLPGGSKVRELARDTRRVFDGLAPSAPRGGGPIGGGSGLGNLSAPSVVGGSGLMVTVLTVAVAFVAIIAALLLLLRVQPSAVRKLLGRVTPSTSSIHSQQITSRSDVVRAFHQVALGSELAAADWWTHSQVVHQAEAARSMKAPAVYEMANVYEVARYLPPEMPLSEQQIQIARRAMERLET
ncbi:MAG: hypothetical protein KDA96_07830 [Planctomycetaceae bacterium]|nr:hypothetical protein [Planctomycetaceae bacterium]